jgi:hypothetical protein
MKAKNTKFAIRSIALLALSPAAMASNALIGITSTTSGSVNVNTSACLQGGGTAAFNTATGPAAYNVVLNAVVSAAPCPLIYGTNNASATGDSNTGDFALSARATSFTDQNFTRYAPINSATVINRYSVTNNSLLTQSLTVTSQIDAGVARSSDNFPNWDAGIINTLSLYGGAYTYASSQASWILRVNGRVLAQTSIGAATSAIVSPNFGVRGVNIGFGQSQSGFALNGTRQSLNNGTPQGNYFEVAWDTGVYSFSIGNLIAGATSLIEIESTVTANNYTPFNYATRPGGTQLASQLYEAGAIFSDPLKFGTAPIVSFDITPGSSSSSSSSTSSSTSSSSTSSSSGGSPVPTPASGALLLIGLGLLAAGIYKQKARHSC